MSKFLASPLLITLLPFVVGLGILAVLGGVARRRQRLAQFGTESALSRLGPLGINKTPVARALRIGVAAAAMSVAIAGPRWGEGVAIIGGDGIDIALALDASLSMLAEDERPNRLERMKQEVRRLRASAPNDRVALLAFAGRSYILSPLTSDDGALELFLENLDPTVVGQAGSALAPPIRQGLDLLAQSQGGGDRALVIMSDGEAFDDRSAALQLAQEARRAGVFIVTVGFGTPGGGTIPIVERGGTDVKRDDRGEVVVTRYDESLLREVAQAAGGEFIPAEATDKGTRVRRALVQLESSRIEEQRHQSRPLRYQMFAAIALLLLFVDAVLADGGRMFRLPGFLKRKGAGASAALLLMLLLPLANASGQDRALRDAVKKHSSGDLFGAVRGYRSAIAAGDRRAVVMYDLGTALLGLDSLDASIEALERASFSQDANLRSRALYNLGLAYLKRGLNSDGDVRSNALRNARRALRTVLLENPGSRDAQWNYELALRQSNEGGGGGGGTPPPQGSEAPRPQEQGEMSRQQAEALLEAAARDERDVQARRQRGSRTQRLPGERDW